MIHNMPCLVLGVMFRRKPAFIHILSFYKIATTQKMWMKQRNIRTFTFGTRQEPIEDQNNREVVPARNISLKNPFRLYVLSFGIAVYLAKINQECFILS